MKNEVIEIAINSLQKTVKESDELFKKNEVSHAYIIGTLEGAINAVVGFLKEQMQNEEALAIIEQMEQEDFDKRDIGF
jgi:hypothetical protein